MRSDKWLAQQLPVAMTDDDFLMRFLSIFQSMSDTVLDQIDSLSHAFDPSVAPEPMVQAMTRWIGVDWGDSTLPERFQRDMLRTYSAEVLQHRGTLQGLRALLALLCHDTHLDGPAEIEVEDGGSVYLREHGDDERPSGSWVNVRIPRPQGFGVEDLVRIIRAEVPLGVTLSIWIDDDQVWPAKTDADAAILLTGGRLPVHYSEAS